MVLVLWVVGALMVAGGLVNLFNKKAEKRLPQRVAVMVLCGGLLSLAVASMIPGGSSSEIATAAGTGDSRAISLVRKTQAEPRATDCLTADLPGGVGVVCNGSAGYLVSGNQVFAVNGVAKNWSAGAKYSKTVEFSDIAAALSGQ